MKRSSRKTNLVEWPEHLGRVSTKATRDAHRFCRGYLESRPCRSTRFSDAAGIRLRRRWASIQTAPFRAGDPQFQIYKTVLQIYKTVRTAARAAFWVNHVAERPNMQEILANAIEMHRTGQFGPAAQLYQQVLGQQKENAEAMHLLGVLHHRRASTRGRGVDRPGRGPASQRLRVPYQPGRGLSRTGQFDRAIGCCRAALRLAPDYPEAVCNLGAALQGLGRQQEAVEQFRRALELNPDFVTVHNNLGIALRKLRQPDEALARFRRAVELDPKFAEAQTNLGQLLLDRGQAEEALPHCQEAARLQPNVAAMHHNLGNVLRKLEQFVDAQAGLS